MDNAWVLDGLKHVGPELAMVGTLLAVILTDLTRIRRASAGFAIAGLLVTSWPACRHLADPAHAVFRGAYSIDTHANHFKLLFLGAGLVAAFFSIAAIKDWRSGTCGVLPRRPSRTI